MHNLTKGTKTTRVVNATAAGQTDINSTAVDMQGYEGVRFTALFGALTATQVTSMKAQQSDDNATFEDIAGSSTGPLADGDGNKMLILDIYRPAKRYVRVVIDRGTANAVVDGVIAEQYLAASEPVTASATVADQTVLSNPAAGTA